jgi:protein-tyrosine kinase
MSNGSREILMDKIETALGKDKVLAHASDENIGSQLVAEGKVKASDIERILRLQHDQNLRFGEAAVKLGLVAETDIQQVFARQFDYSYLTPGQGNFSPELSAAYQPFSKESEALRKLRTQLQLRWFSKGHSSLAITSATGAEGASWLAANLAIIFAQTGRKTLLIDADLRAPAQHTFFKLGNRLGLSDILGDRADAGSISRINGIDDLSVLSAGTVPPNPAELLGRTRLGALLNELSSNYEVILIDTPPANNCSDFQTIVAYAAGGALIVTRSNRTRLADATRLKEMIHAAGAEVVGGLINHF